MGSGQNKTPRKEPTWEKAFLLAFSRTGNVRASCEAAKITRSVVYARRESDPEFAAAWNDAREDAADLLEEEVRRRAFDGVDEPVVYQGELMGVWLDPSGQVVTKDTPGAKQAPLTVKKYSDTLLIFLTKGTRPEKFRDNARVEHAGDPAAPLKHEHEVSVTTRIEHLAAAFAGAADRASQGGVPSHGAGKQVDPGRHQGRPDPQAG